MKKMIVVALVVLTFSNINTIAYAEPTIDEVVIEEYQYTSRLSSDISISNNTASCKSSVYGFSGLATKVVVTQTLQKKSGNSWAYVTSWRKTFNSWLAIYTTSKSSLSSGTYRLKTVAKVYSGNSYETITVYSRTASC